MDSLEPRVAIILEKHMGDGNSTDFLYIRIHDPRTGKESDLCESEGRDLFGDDVSARLLKYHGATIVDSTTYYKHRRTV